MHINSVLICFWICLCTLVPLIVCVLDIIERTQSPLSFCNPHFDDDPRTHSLSANRAHIPLSCTFFYTYQSLYPVPIHIPIGPFP